MIDRDTIIKLADDVWGHTYWSPAQLDRLERFAASVEAKAAVAERKQCALTAWEIVQYEVHADLADKVAQAIRARSRA